MTRAESVRVARHLFQDAGGGSTPTSALQLEFNGIDLNTARKLNRLWHSRLPRFGRFACRVAYSASFDGRFFAVAIWTNPIGFGLPQMEWLELNRMAIAPDAPKNTASRMLSWMARDIRKKFPDVVNLISYQDTEAHSGCIYKAAGWQPTSKTDGREWTRPSRQREMAQTTSDKQRWELSLTPTQR